MVLPVAVFHSCTVLSKPPEAIRLPSGDQASERTLLVWPRKAQSSVPAGCASAPGRVCRGAEIFGSLAGVRAGGTTIVGGKGGAAGRITWVGAESRLPIWQACSKAVANACMLAKRCL